ALLGVPALLVANHNHRQAVETCVTTNDCWIVCKPAIAVNFDEVLKQTLDNVEGIKAVRVPRQLHALESGLVFMIGRCGFFHLRLSGWPQKSTVYRLAFFQLTWQPRLIRFPSNSVVPSTRMVEWGRTRTSTSFSGKHSSTTSQFPLWPSRIE